MRAVGTGSWRLNFDVPMEPHVALFVRDSLALEISSATAKLPPHLEGDIPDYSSLVTDDDHERLESRSPRGGNFRSAVRSSSS